MSISAIGSTNPILKTLESNGLSERKAKVVQSDLDAAIKSTTTSTGTKPDIAAVRDVLDKRIAADVASGALSKEDAAAVTKTFDEMQGVETAATEETATAGAAAPQGAGGAKPAGGGGGGGGGSTDSSEKTELSRTVTVSGSVKTTTIAYTDGTSTTETSAATDSEVKKEAASKPVESAGAGTVEAEYLPKIVPGTLVDVLA